VNRLVIGPIERLVELVRKISANPLGVEYKMMGEKEGFVEGLETTVLLTTITKIGALMRVGFGEAGASVIAKNLAESSGGRLNLMGSGTMIRSIFGFCDVRQFTDTTECLQEEVMLFVNRIAHILHSIVVQCSGSANKNIGDAFLLTWKLDDRLSVEQVSALADQALLAFCKSLIELSRYQEFITNFSVAATARLYKRFPEYNVRIGSGLHVGWAIEGAIGSHRKIDASYLSPHVNNTEYLESSTKAYGVPLLLSEPFFRLLSPTAAKYCRQVDRIRRSEYEEPMGLFTYDSDILIDWNDQNRPSKKTEVKANMKNRLLDAARKAKGGREGGSNASDTSAAAHAAAQEHIPAGNHVPHHAVRKGSKDQVQHKQSVSAGRGRRASALIIPMIAPVVEVKDEGERAEEEDLERRRQKAKEAPTLVVPKYTQEVWAKDEDIVELRHRVNDSFRALWENGIAAYIKGDWQKARDIFHETMRLSKNKDGPSKFLMEVIDEHGGTAPPEWPGYRADY
jgi:class 3 adenylate cyclase